jgi:hypothetical protein
VQRNKITRRLPSFARLATTRLLSFQNKETAVPQHA